MDIIQIYCAIVVSIMLVVFVRSAISKNTPSRKPSSYRRPSSSTTQVSGGKSDAPEKSQTLPHQVQELRHMEISELQKYNIQYGKYTDRYWREIFRRQNSSHQPDHINVSNLQISNIITALDENLPEGNMHEVTITGLVPKPFSARRCEVMRFLRDRISTFTNFELIFDADRIRIVPSNCT